MDIRISLRISLCDLQLFSRRYRSRYLLPPRRFVPVCLYYRRMKPAGFACFFLFSKSSKSVCIQGLTHSEISSGLILFFSFYYKAQYSTLNWRGIKMFVDGDFYSPALLSRPFLRWFYLLSMLHFWLLYLCSMTPTGMQRKKKPWPEGEAHAEVKGFNKGREHSSGGLLPRRSDADWAVPADPPKCPLSLSPPVVAAAICPLLKMIYLSWYTKNWPVFTKSSRGDRRWRDTF